MEITETLSVINGKQWREWLEKNHSGSKEIWLIYYKKESGNPRIGYNEAVEEALCYGWIDGIVKVLDKDRTVQRFSPRRKISKLSELNKERIRKLIKEGKMTPAGMESIKQHLQVNKSNELSLPELSDYKMPEDIIRILKEDKVVWGNFQSFSNRYKIIRVAWIDAVRDYPTEFAKRLNYFLKMTSKNKMYGLIR